MNYTLFQGNFLLAYYEKKNETKKNLKRVVRDNLCLPLRKQLRHNRRKDKREKNIKENEVKSFFSLLF